MFKLQARAMGARWLLVALPVTLTAAVALLLQQPRPVDARSDYLSAARAHYPAITGTRLDSCTLCHTNAPALNSFGAAFQAAGHSFEAVELMDSDDDGTSNIAEIKAGTLPGDPSSKPESLLGTIRSFLPALSRGEASPTPTSGDDDHDTPTATARASRTPTRTPTPRTSATPTRTPAASRTPTPGPTATTAPPASTGYKVIGWNDLGMHCMNKNYSNLAVLPPYNTLYAEVIRQGAEPQLVTSGVIVEYYIEGNTYSAGKSNFWQYAQQLFGLAQPLPVDTGLTGSRLSGQMIAQPGGFFKIDGVPLVPYSDVNPTVEQPYQIAHLTVKDAATGRILAETRPVAPSSTEMHCEACHADGMRNGIATGNVETNILTLHDRLQGTNLMNARPVLCASCHASNALGTTGQAGVENLSLAMHGLHKNVFPTPNTMDNTCYQCHPGQQTKCLRDVMYSEGKTCISCHGDLAAVANPARNPWVDEPKCGTCHGSNYAEEAGKRYRDSKGHGGLFCETCHGSPHAILPSTQPNDNLQNIALQGHAGTLDDCKVCHGTTPSGPGPHGISGR